MLLPKKIVFCLWIVLLGVSWTEARPEEDKGVIDMIYAIFDNLDSVEFESTSRSPTTVTPTKHLTSGEDFSDDTSPSSTLTTEDNYTEETPLYVTSTMENSFSEVTSSSSTTTSDEDFYTEESTLSSIPTATDQSTLEKDELSAESMSTELVIIGCVDFLDSCSGVASAKLTSSRRSYSQLTPSFGKRYSWPHPRPRGPHRSHPFYARQPEWRMRKPNPMGPNNWLLKPGVHKRWPMLNRDPMGPNKSFSKPGIPKWTMPKWTMPKWTMPKPNPMIQNKRWPKPDVQNEVLSPHSGVTNAGPGSGHYDNVNHHYSGTSAIDQADHALTTFQSMFPNAMNDYNYPSKPPGVYEDTYPQSMRPSGGTYSQSPGVYDDTYPQSMTPYGGTYSQSPGVYNDTYPQSTRPSGGTYSAISWSIR
ncbi:conserved hypothetical protein [Cotesia vestalis bracovirus]|nr:conserved hypothetical protein [Cotesia vestalis bracovirus]